MKKLFITLFVLLTLGVNAQTESHLKFKGIPITGTLDNMINKLEAQGYVLTESDNKAAILYGKFANEYCDIIVCVTPNTNIVYKIIVVFESVDNWWSLKSDYYKLKDQISSKYVVTATKENETFFKPYYEGDGYELQALRNGKCVYYSKFNVDYGEIAVLISKIECGICLYYTDSIGDNLNKEEENQSSYDDL